MFFIKPAKSFNENFKCVIEGTDPSSVSFKRSGDSTICTHPEGETEIRNDYVNHMFNVSGKTWIKIEGNKRPRAITEARKNKYVAKELLTSTASSTSTTATEMKITASTTKLKDVEFDPNQFKLIHTGTFFDEFVSHKVLYVSAEMSPLDIHEFVQFYPGLEDVDFFYMGEHKLNPEEKVPATAMLNAILKEGWDLVVFDSLIEIQGIVADEMNISSKKAEKEVLAMVGAQKGGFNKEGIYTSFLLIQQMNKGGEFVGSNNLKHMTDAFLKLYWSKEEPGKRVMEMIKNRIGDVKNPLYYRFGDGDGIDYDVKRYRETLKLRNGLTSDEEMGIQEDSLDNLMKVLQGTNPAEPKEIHYSNIS